MKTKDYISKIAESKAKYHKLKTKMSFEEKLEIIIELQKIDIEMIKNNQKRKNTNKLRYVWRVED